MLSLQWPRDWMLSMGPRLRGEDVLGSTLMRTGLFMRALMLHHGNIYATIIVGLHNK